MNDKVKINVKELINALECASFDPLNIDYLIELDDRFKKAMINILEFEKGLGCYELCIIRDFMVDNDELTLDNIGELMDKLEEEDEEVPCSEVIKFIKNHGDNIDVMDYIVDYNFEFNDIPLVKLFLGKTKKESECLSLMYYLAYHSEMDMKDFEMLSQIEFVMDGKES